MTLCGALGAVFFKLYSARRSIPMLLTGLLSYGIGAPLNVFLLQKLPYTVVMPANALTFVWSLVFARLVFGEHIGIYKIVGIVLVICGLLLLVA